MVLSVEIRLFNRITRRAFHGPVHERLWCGRMVYSGGRLPLGFQFPVSLHPAMEKVQPCPQQGPNKSWCPEFLLHIKVWSFGAHVVCQGAPVAARPLWLHAPR